MEQGPLSWLKAILRLFIFVPNINHDANFAIVLFHLKLDLISELLETLNLVSGKDMVQKEVADFVFIQVGCPLAAIPFVPLHHF